MPKTRQQQKAEDEVGGSGFEGDNEGSPNSFGDRVPEPSEKTGASKKSVVRNAEVAALKEIDEKKKELDAERIQIEEKTQQVLSSLKNAQFEVKKLERALVRADKNAPGYNQLEDMLDEAQKNVELLADDYERAKGKEQRDLDRLQRKLDILKAEKQAQIMDLEEGEEGSQKLSDEEDVAVDPPNPKDLQVVEWRLRNEAQRAAQEEADKQLAEELQRAEDEQAKIKAELEKAEKKATEIKVKIQGGGSNAAVKPPSVVAVEPVVVKEDSEHKLLKQLLVRNSVSKDLPIFDGKAEQWPRFYNDYVRTTELCGFSDSENLLRLGKCLKGEALASVELLMVSPENVPDIMKFLKTTFGDSDFVIKTMKHKLKRYSTLHGSRIEQLIEFGMMVAQLTTTIKVMKDEKYLSDPSLLEELENKLPHHMQEKWVEWTDQLEERRRDLEFFSEWIQIQVSVARRLRKPGMSDNKPSRGIDTSWRSRPQQKEKCYVTSEIPPERNEQRNKTCYACGRDGHYAYSCRTFQAKSITDRLSIVDNKKLCRVCLIPGHMSSVCRKKKQCGVGGCTAYHHPLLHKPPVAVQQIAPHNVNVQTEAVNIVNGNSGSTFMGMLPVVVKGPLGEREVLAFIDNGSSVTLIEESLAHEVGLEGRRQQFCMLTMGVLQRCGESEAVSCGIRGTWKSAKNYDLADIRTIPKIKLEAMSQDAERIKRDYPHLANVPLPSFVNQVPKLLIGRSHVFLTTDSKQVGSSPDMPCALQCRLGWTLGGRNRSKQSIASVAAVQEFHWCNQISSDEELHQLVKDSFSTENFGVKIPSQKLMSVDNEKALQILKETTRRVVPTCEAEENRFETGLLWKSPDVVLPDSYGLALKRLHCQERRMDSNAVFAATLVKKFQEYEDKGFIRKLTPEEAMTRTSKTWYLPHFGVYNPNKPDKTRLCFDAKAEVEGVSLNSMLLQGPDLNNSLPAVLLRFRQYAVACSGDIKDMFHRVFVRKEDQTSQRFLWRGMDRSKPPEVYVMQVMTFGSTCSPCSAQFVKNHNADLHVAEYPVANKVIKKNTYVDDVLPSKPTVKEAIDTVHDVNEVMRKGGFEVRNWNSNSKEVLESIPADLRAKEAEISMDGEDSPAGRILGLWWFATTDEFCFKLTMHKVQKDILDLKRAPTKREVLRVAMSVYDPLGFVGHLVVKVKILLQDVWRAGIDWDDSISGVLLERWNLWIEELHEIVNVRVRRCYSVNIPTANGIELHIFCDASEKAYAAVAYLRVVSDAGVEVSIVTSKSRVTPLKPLSVSRLELQAAVMGTRLAAAIKEELEIKIDRTVYWTDSTTVLKWINSDARNYKTFVAHRIGEILEATGAEQWRYVPTAENVADDATRDVEACDLSPGGRWFVGPGFLQDGEDLWPVQKIKDLEVKPEQLELKAVVMSVTIPEVDWNFNQFSHFIKMKRVVAIILRWKFRENRKSPYVTVMEMNRAEKALMRVAQMESFPNEMESLNGGKPLPRSSSLKQLEPFVGEDGLLRVRGRLGRSKMNEDYRHPVILDKKHHFTRLLVEWYHEMLGHVGQKTVANELRQRYWIPGVLTVVKKVSRQCVACQRRRVTPHLTRMADLPAFRLKENIRPFSNCGLDFFGPIVIKIGRRTTDKRWGALFTCLSTRAVHLEVAAGLNVDAAINVITRMAARRGRPDHIYCDNGTNFHGAENELKRSLMELEANQLGKKLAVKGIQFHYNPPAAPHMGGAWERLVGSVKRAMEPVLRDKHPTEDVLQTVMCEAEWTVNSRPLTEVSVDPTDPSCLTPNHFLIGWSGGKSEEVVQQPVWGQFDRHDLYLRKQYRVAQQLAEGFWGRWRKEFLPTLTRRSKWLKTGEQLKVDDVVVVINDQEHRNAWPLGRIVAVFPGSDGVVRVVQVKTEGGSYRRPVSKVCKLDLRVDEVPSSGGRMWGRQGNEISVCPENQSRVEKSGG